MTVKDPSHDDDHEMSMDEILASIRRYVSADEPNDKATARSSPLAPDSLKSMTYASSSDIVHLSQEMAVAPSLTATPYTPPSSIPSPTSAYVMNTPLSQPVALSTLSEPLSVPPAGEQQPQIHASEAPSSSDPLRNIPTHLVTREPEPHTMDDTLLSTQSASATLGSFSKLKETTEKIKQQQPPAATYENSNNLHQPTLDQLISSLARPMILNWLDQNLPLMVERMVTEEIEKLTKNI
jgi:cell pole-organizing protein PopZ